MTTQPFTVDQIRVARNILAIAEKYLPLTGVPPLVHLAVTAQESGWDDTASGDSGNSNGPYQIYEPAHPGITREVATNPGYDYAFWECWQPWRDAWKAYGTGWENADFSTRVSILQQFAPNAQGSIPWSAEIATQRLNQATAMLEMLS